MWTDRRLLDLFGIAHPIVQAPMAGAMDTALAVGVARAGGLGSLPGGMLSHEQLRDQTEKFRAEAPGKPLNLNFFAHKPPVHNNARANAWHNKLVPYYEEFGLDSNIQVPTRNRAAFDGTMCTVVEQLKPEIVSFHYGLPEATLVKRVKDAGCKIIASATTSDEARFLEDNGCHAVIAQGVEAGGHRGMFLSNEITTQLGTFALVPQIADAIELPVIASGGIGDARGVVRPFCWALPPSKSGPRIFFAQRQRSPRPIALR